MFRPQNIKLFEPTNPEHEVAESILQETMNMVSPNILWFKFDAAETALDRDEYDELVGDSPALDEETYFKAIEIKAYVESEPIIQELTRLGVNQEEAVNMIVSKKDFRDRVGAEPLAGDLFRLRYVTPGEKDRDIYYRVSTVVPNDMFHWRFATLLINAEMTSLEHVPESVKHFENIE